MFPDDTMRAFWRVEAGEKPGKASRQFARQWTYTWADCEADRNKPTPETLFTARGKEVHGYAIAISGRASWVNVSFRWL